MALQPGEKGGDGFLLIVPSSQQTGRHAQGEPLPVGQLYPQDILAAEQRAPYPQRPDGQREASALDELQRIPEAGDGKQQRR